MDEDYDDEINQLRWTDEELDYLVNLHMKVLNRSTPITTVIK